MPKWIDTHGHVNASAFNDNWADVIQRALDDDTWIIMPGFQHPTSQKGLEIVGRYPEGVYAAPGFHPTHVGETRNVFDPSLFDDMLPNPKMVAVGETGLDYYRIDKKRFDELRAAQIDALNVHIDLATKYNLPLIAHCRDAYDDVYDVLEKALRENKLPRRGVVHCYVGDWATAQKFLALGFLISFTGIITFTDDEKLLDVVRKIPLEKCMVETDAPYLSPVPHRGKQNEPVRVKHIGEKIAAMKNIPVADVAAATTETARNFFNI